MKAATTVLLVVVAVAAVLAALVARRRRFADVRPGVTLKGADLPGMREPAVFRGALSRQECAGLLRSLPGLGGRFRLGRYVHSGRPFMHSCSDRYGLDWAGAYRLVAARPGSQLACRAQLDRRAGGLHLGVLRLGCGHWTVPTHFDCWTHVAACVHGERTFYLSPPSPRMPREHALAVTLRAGDALLVPAGWWHEVRNHDGRPSVLVNSRQDDGSDERAYRRLLARYTQFWPGRVFEQTHGYDDAQAPCPSGYAMAVRAGVHTYNDLLA